MSWYQYYEPTQPKSVRGGIKATSKRGAFGQTWWGKRWENLLHEFNIASRLQRGKRYARKGQVRSIDVAAGHVTAEVQGSRSQPYAIDIRLRTFSDDEWDTLLAALRRQPYVAAALLSGEMPPELESLAADAGLSLFPEAESDLQTDCSCPDWSNPCKHIAAVYYLLAEEFDRDPFLLLRLRGLSRGALLKRLGGEVDSGASTDPPAEPLHADATFWTGGGVPEDVFGTVKAPPSHAALPRQLGAFPFWRPEQPLAEALAPTYAAVSEAACTWFADAASTGSEAADSE